MRWMPSNAPSGQQALVIKEALEQLNKAHWIQGFAGSGKTVVMVLMARQIAAMFPESSICFLSFTHALKEMVSSGLTESQLQRIRVKTHTEFVREQVPCDYVFVDEVQDIPHHDLKKIRVLAQHLFVSGDSDQRIYEAGASEGEIREALSPATKSLKEIFRLTERLRAFVLSILPSATLEAGQRAFNNADAQIHLVRFSNRRAEFQWVWKKAVMEARAQDPSVILCPRHKDIQDFGLEVARALGLPAPPAARRMAGRPMDYSDFNRFWFAHRQPLAYLGNGNGAFADSDTKPFVYIMTFHSSKGLDFRNVFIPGMGETATIVSSKALESYPALGRRLLFVACTRSRQNLFVSYTDRREHPYLSTIPDAVVTRVNGDTLNSDVEEEDFF